MDWRGVVADSVREHRLSEGQRRALLALGHPGGEPAAQLARLPLLIAALAGLLSGLGLIFYIASQWAELPRTAQFGLLQAAVAATALGVFARPVLRLPLGLACLLAIGGLFAFFGQTYQTGADAWQLFALWAVLGLPLALGVRADAMWAAWVLVAMTATTLWVQTHTGHRWRAEAADLPAHLIGWALALGLTLVLGGRAGRRLGAGIVARRSAACLAVLLVTSTAVTALIADDPAASALIALLVLGGAAWRMSRPAGFDLFNLSAAALGLNVVLVGGVARLLFHGHASGDAIGRFLLLGLIAAGLLAATVSGVLRLSRAAAQQPAGGQA
jgi:uncharacterized membrane protein